MPSANETVFQGPMHDRIHEQMLARLRALEDDRAGISERLHEIDQEWDLDKCFFLGAGLIVTTAGVVAVARTKRPSPLLVAGPFLVLRALAGWAPPLSILRLLGVRSRQEIEHERTALRAMRGDFDNTWTADDAFDAAEASP